MTQIAPRIVGDEKGRFGKPVINGTRVPVELVVKALPVVEYAAFTLCGEEIVFDWNQTIYQGWLPGSGYESAYDYLIECYDERFKGLEQIAESTLEVYVPVRRRRPGD